MITFYIISSGRERDLRAENTSSGSKVVVSFFTNLL